MNKSREVLTTVCQGETFCLDGLSDMRHDCVIGTFLLQKQRVKNFLQFSQGALYQHGSLHCILPPHYHACQPDVPKFGVNFELCSKQMHSPTTRQAVSTLQPMTWEHTFCRL